MWIFLDEVGQQLLPALVLAGIAVKQNLVHVVRACGSSQMPLSFVRLLSNAFVFEPFSIFGQIVKPFFFSDKIFQDSESNHQKNN